MTGIRVRIEAFVLRNWAKLQGAGVLEIFRENREWGYIRLHDNQLRELSSSPT